MSVYELSVYEMSANPQKKCSPQSGMFRNILLQKLTTALNYF